MEVDPVEEKKTKPEISPAPQYHVVLHDDDNHTYVYVIAMCMQLFAMTKEEGYTHAQEVDTQGITILLTTHLEHAELKRDQIRAFGPDPYIDRASPPMTVTLEPA